MTDTKELVKRLRRADGSDLLPKVMLGAFTAEQTCLTAATTIESQAAYIERLEGALNGIIDWADFAIANPNEFTSHGVNNLEGPAFDNARAVLQSKP